MTIHKALKLFVRTVNCKQAADYKALEQLPNEPSLTGQEAQSPLVISCFTQLSWAFLMFLTTGTGELWGGGEVLGNRHTKEKPFRF
jgi:hypothetical protein